MRPRSRIRKLHMEAYVHECSASALDTTIVGKWAESISRAPDEDRDINDEDIRKPGTLPNITRNASLVEMINGGLVLAWNKTRGWRANMIVICGRGVSIADAQE